MKQSRKQTFVRKATKRDVGRIRTWLKAEEKLGIRDNFYCNLHLIEAGQLKGKLNVLVEAGEPIAFSLGSDSILEILAVKADRRHDGFGTILAKHVLDECRLAGAFGIEGQCMPRSSIPFWLKMGFFPVHHAGTAFMVAYRFRRKFTIPNGEISFLRISMFGRHRETPVGNPYYVRAAFNEDGTYQLEDEFVEYLSVEDIHVKVDIDDSEVWMEKAKYSKNAGFETRDSWIRLSKFAHEF